MSAPRLELDYVAPPRRKRAAGIVLLALSLGLAFLLLERYRDAKLEIARIESATGLLAGERRAPPRERLAEEVRAAEAVVRQLGLPWAAMIHAVEGAAGPDVALLQMQPEARERTLRLTAEARNERALLEYLRRLAAADALAEVHLASHQVVTEEPRRPIQFAVLARLK